MSLSAVSNASLLVALRDVTPPLAALLKETESTNRSARRLVQLQRFAKKMDHERRSAKKGKTKNKRGFVTKESSERELELRAVRWQVYMEELVFSSEMVRGVFATGASYLYDAKLPW